MNIIPLSAESWEPFCVVNTIPNIVSIKWSSYMGLIHMSNIGNNHAMLSETILQKKMNKIMKVIQINHKTLEIILDGGLGKFDKENIKRIEMNETIKGLDIYNNILLTWNGMTAFLYQIGRFILS